MQMSASIKLLYIEEAWRLAIAKGWSYKLNMIVFANKIQTQTRTGPWATVMNIMHVIELLGHESKSGLTALTSHLWNMCVTTSYFSQVHASPRHFLIETADETAVDEATSLNRQQPMSHSSDDEPTATTELWLPPNCIEACYVKTHSRKEYADCKSKCKSKWDDWLAVWRVRPNVILKKILLL